MDIDGLGDKIVEQLVYKSIIQKPSDLYSLTIPVLTQMACMGRKSSLNLLDALKNSKKVQLNQFIYALGMKDIGEVSAKVLANYFGSLEAIQHATLDELRSIDNFGDIMANNVKEFWQDTYNLELVQGLVDVGIEINYSKKRPVFIQNNKILRMRKMFEGKTVVITGKLTKYTRVQIKDLLDQLGSETANNITIKTDYLIVGKNAGSKLRKAQALNVKVISEDQFRHDFDSYEGEG